MVTMDKIMQLDIIREQTQLVAGHEGLNKSVSYITIMEAPDFYQWVSGGEFVLTTWYAFSQNPTMQEDAFRQLAKRVSCIAIKLDRFIKEIPEEFIAIANEYQTPLLAVRRETKFRQVIQAVAAEVQDAQTNILLKVEKHYQVLMQAALASDDFSVLLRSTGKNSGKSCFCLNDEGKLLGYCLSAGVTAYDINQKAAAFYSFYRENNNMQMSFRTENFHAFSCIARRKLLGFLVLISEEDLSEQVVLMAQQTASILSLKLLEGYESKQKRLGKLLWEISEGKVSRERLESFGLNCRQGVLYVAVLAAGGKNIAWLLEKIGFLKNNDKILTIAGTTEIVFVCAAEKDGKSNIPAVFHSFAEWLGQGEQQLVLAFGNKVDSPSNLADSLDLARKTAKSAWAIGAYGCQDSKDWLLPCFLLNGLDSLEVLQIEKNILQPLQQYDVRYKAELLFTLKTVLQSKKSDLAAAKLHIHINTLRYRLAKIHDITGFDPQNPLDAGLLWIAYLLSELNKK